MFSTLFINFFSFFQLYYLFSYSTHNILPHLHMVILRHVKYGMYVHYFFRSIFKCLISVKSQFGEKNLVLIDKFAPLVLRMNVTMSQPLPNFALLFVK